MPFFYKAAQNKEVFHFDKEAYNAMFSLEFCINTEYLNWIKIADSTSLFMIYEQKQVPWPSLF